MSFVTIWVFECSGLSFLFNIGSFFVKFNSYHIREQSYIIPAFDHFSIKSIIWTAISINLRMLLLCFYSPLTYWPSFTIRLFQLHFCPPAPFVQQNPWLTRVGWGIRIISNIHTELIFYNMKSIQPCGPFCFFLHFYYKILFFIIMVGSLVNKRFWDLNCIETAFCQAQL